jgi:DNA-binding NarL/FixJ family response regulator
MKSSRHILIVDDHTIVRQGLKRIIEDVAGLTVTGEAANADEAMDFLSGHVFDLVILDINLPGKSGLEILTDIKRLHPGLPVLVLTMHPEEQFAIRVLRLGASGYLNKDSPSDEIIDAILTILGGRRYLSASLSEMLLDDLSPTKERLPHETLSDREYQVLRMIGDGKTASEIAVELSLSVKTISTYRTRLLEKLKMTTNAELMRYALTNKLSG